MARQEVRDSTPPQVAPDQSLEGRAFRWSLLAALFSTFVLVPIILGNTIGIGNLFFFVFLVAPAGLIICVNLESALHSISQLIAGRIAKSRLKYAVIGPVTVCGSDSPPRFRWNRRWLAYSGLYVGFPEGELTAAQINRHNRFSLMVRLLLVVITMVGLVAAFILGVPPWMLRPATVGAVGLLVSVILSLIILRQSEHRQESESESDRFLAAQHFVRASVNGERPRDYDVTLLSKLTMVPDGTAAEASGWLLSYQRALDSGALEAAESYLQRALSTVKIMHTTLQLAVFREAAFFAAYRHKDADTARIWLKQAKRKAFDFHTQARVEAAILLAEGDNAAARDIASRGIEALQSSLDPGLAKLDADLLEKIRLTASQDQPAAIEEGTPQ